VGGASATEAAAGSSGDGSRPSLEPAGSVRAGGGGAIAHGTSPFVCPVSGKVLGHQRVVLIKPSGVVMEHSSYERAALPSRTCPVSGKSFDPSGDVLELVAGGTGHLGHAGTKAVAVKARAVQMY